jgi:hypothetical protein
MTVAIVIVIVTVAIVAAEVARMMKMEVEVEAELKSISASIAIFKRKLHEEFNRIKSMGIVKKIPMTIMTTMFLLHVVASFVLTANSHTKRANYIARLKMTMTRLKITMKAFSNADPVVSNRRLSEEFVFIRVRGGAQKN